MFPILVLLVASLCSYRLYIALFRRPHFLLKNSSTSTCSLAVFLGSGGHTSEALQLLSALDFARYTPRRYFISDGDALSAQKAVALEHTKSLSHTVRTQETGQDYLIITIPRARQVHQPLFSTPFSALWSLLACIYHLTISPILSSQERGNFLTDVLVLNGPGTCAPLCIAIIINRFLGLSSPRVVYVESFARVHSLSLSARLLRPLVDRFVVQWPQLLRNERTGECVGWLV